MTNNHAAVSYVHTVITVSVSSAVLIFYIHPVKPKELLLTLLLVCFISKI
jgi:hypothetical protein